LDAEGLLEIAPQRRRERRATPSWRRSAEAEGPPPAKRGRATEPWDLVAHEKIRDLGARYARTPIPDASMRWSPALFLRTGSSGSTTAPPRPGDTKRTRGRRPEAPALVQVPSTRYPTSCRLFELDGASTYVELLETFANAEAARCPDRLRRDDRCDRRGTP